MEFYLFYVGDVNNMSTEDAKKAQGFISVCKHAIVATNNSETGARLSALANLPEQTVKELWFATDSNSQKVLNLRNDSRMEAMYTDGDGQVILAGNAAVFTDLETKKAKWQPWMQEYFTDGVEGEALCFIRFTPSTVRAMVDTESK